MTNAKLKYDTATRSKLYILTSNIRIRSSVRRATCNTL